MFTEHSENIVVISESLERDQNSDNEMTKKKA